MKLKHKSALAVCVLFAALLILGGTPVFAAEGAIPSISIDVLLQNDGSAVITENWEVRGVSSGTEYYKALYNMDGMSVHSLLVWDESGAQYETLDGWDTELSREEKSGTCGILKTSDGYELCWGIGSYGDHRYTIQYTLEGLVKDYGDYAGFYHQFVSELSSAPEAVLVEIRAADTSLTENNARIWAYGFTGEAEIGGGSLGAFSSDALGGGDYVNLLCRFDRSLFPMASAAGITFEELRESAESENSNTVLYVLIAVLTVIVVAALVLLAFFSSRYKLADGTTVRLPAKKQIEPNWSVPFSGGIPAAYSAMNLLRKGVSCEKLMGAYLIRWQEAGYISIEEREVGRKKRKPQKEEAIVFNLEKAPEQGAERTLYEILAGGADSDGILRTSEIEEWAQELYEDLTAWAEEVNDEGERELIQSGTALADAKGVVRFTASGFDRAVKLLGFREYLVGLRRQSEDRAAPRELWGDYLVFAALFDIGEQTLESLKALDPAYFDTFAGIYGCNAYSMIYFMTMTNHISSASTPNTDGIGGDASSVGGGGFSGGGGGGSR